MGAFNCCCGGCCSDACSQVIDYIEIDIIEGASSTTYTRTVGQSIIDAKCYLAFFVGQNALVTRNPGASPCFDAANLLSTIYDVSITITQTGALPIDAISFDCTSPNATAATVQIATSGTSRTYYWPSDVYYKSGPATYKGTAASLAGLISAWNSPVGSCDTDATVAAAIKASLVGSLSGTYPEFASGNFSVTVVRTPMASTGSSLALAAQTYTRTMTCSTSEPDRTLTVTRIRHGFVLELTPGGMVGTLMGSEETTCDFASSPPADVYYIRRADVGFTRSLGSTTACWGNGTNYSHTISLSSFTNNSSGDDCSSYGAPCIPTVAATAPSAKTITVNVRVFYV